MIIIRNNLIPFRGFTCINTLGVLFLRKDVHVSSRLEYHEAIHTAKQYEIMTLSALLALVLCNIFQSWWYLFIVVALPLVVYFLGFLLELIIPPYHNVKATMGLGKKLHKIWMDAYSDNCFEREANANEQNDSYLVTRVPFIWIKYIIPRNERR